MTKTSGTQNNVNINQVTQFTKRWEIEEQEWNTIPTVDIKVRNRDSGDMKSIIKIQDIFTLVEFN